MKVVNTVQELKAELAAFRSEGKKIGLVPTMGALHAGHASLVGRSVKENDVTVVSVFVNPTQFNDKKDLETYPRTLEADCRLLESMGADIVFAPSAEEVYPEPKKKKKYFLLNLIRVHSLILLRTPLWKEHSDQDISMEFARL